MSEKILSVFIDESGDFGPYEAHAPYYLVSMILHNQSTDVSENIKLFDSHLLNLGYQNHAIHTGPLIRRESVYSNDLVEDRKRLFNALFNFARKLDFQYSCIKVKKSECLDVITMTSKVSKALADVLSSNELIKSLSTMITDKLNSLKFSHRYSVHYILMLNSGK